MTAYPHTPARQAPRSIARKPFFDREHRIATILLWQRDDTYCRASLERKSDEELHRIWRMVAGA